jgi:3',5'-cyclic AMP phosphodiesterase CpdA
MSVLHLSDTHVSAGADGAVASAQALRAVLRSEALRPRPDCVVVTGDVTDHGTATEYDEARAVLARFTVPVHVLPGNHDHAPTMLAAMGGQGWVDEAPRERGRCYYAVTYPGFRLLCCDTSIPGRHDGELGTTQLDWVDEQLSAAGDTPVLLAMHHPPFDSGIEAMDDIGLGDAAALEAVLARHHNVVRVLTGHLHRQVVATVAGVPVVGVGSTRRQVDLDLAVGAGGGYVDEPPSLAWHLVSADGRVVSHYLPVTDAAATYEPF